MQNVELFDSSNLAENKDRSHHSQMDQARTNFESKTSHNRIREAD